MSATKDIKKDPVIEMLKGELESDPKNELVKMLLYANPNGSGVQDMNGVTYQSIARRIDAMNRGETSDFDYTDLELSTKSVSIPVRVRFAIEELVGALEMLNLARTRIHVEQSNGASWPPSNVVVGSSSIKVGLQFVKSMKAIVREYLIAQLPALIHDCYEAHYKNTGNFSYSLLETKLYVVRPEVMRAFITWVEHTVLQPYAQYRDTDPIFTTITTKNGGTVDNVPTRALMLDDMWVTTSIVKNTGIHKYPPHYMKLCKVICARLGKILRTPVTSVDEWKSEGTAQEIQYKLDAAARFVNKCVMDFRQETGREPSSAISLESRKKDFQRAIYDILLSRMDVALAKAERNQLASAGALDMITCKRHEVISLILDIHTNASGIGYQDALVYMDSFQRSIATSEVHGHKLYTFLPFFTKKQFLDSLRGFADGVCNPRVMETFYRFISTSSVVERDSSRKKIPHQIEVEILKHVDLNRFEYDRSDEPALCFSQASLQEAGMLGSPIAQVRDTKTGLDGLRQNGVMSLTAALKNKDASAALVQTGREDLLLRANTIDEVADCYVMVYAASLDARKAKKNKDAAAQRQLAKHTGRGYGASPTYTYTVGASPAVAQVPNYASPSVQGQGGDLFREATVETQYPVQAPQPVFQQVFPSTPTRSQSTGSVSSGQGVAPPAFPVSGQPMFPVAGQPVFPVASSTSRMSSPVMRGSSAGGQSPLQSASSGTDLFA